MHRHDDVTTYANEQIPAADIICGGWPCQDLSLSGARRGLAGSRSGLFFSALRVCEKLGPRLILLENVPGLLSSNGGRDFATVLLHLEQRGYSVSWRVLDVQYFGIPTKRRRLIIAASLGNGAASRILFDGQSSNGHYPPGATERDTDTAALLREAWRDSGASIEPAVGFPCRGFQAPAELGLPMARVTNPPAVLVDGEARKLTPLECERLQGFPDNWTAGLSDESRYRLTGNAVPVPLAKWLGERVLEAYN